MTIEEFGASLREERESRGISLDDVANRLKISVRMLHALEEGDVENFPHIAYAKGFIRSYASFLGLSQEEIADAVHALDPFTKESPAFVPVDAQPKSNQSSSFLIPFAVLFLVLGLLGAGGYYLWTSGLAKTAYEWVIEKTKTFTTSEKTDTSNRRSAPLSGSRDDAPLPTQNGKVPASNPDTAERNLIAGNPQKDTQQSSDALSAFPQNPVSSSEAGQNQPKEPNQPSQPAGGAQQVVITATEACWIHSTADSTETRQFSLRKGDTFALTFREKLEVKLGNAGGVRFRYNGEELPPVGKAGQVRTVIFPSKEVL
ncbi:MAG: helix-turn-helix domain-containing protein [Desulfovibrio sp.]|nr:helix-turn-helix domain-containing protein [Desulfovibrio sp.]